MFGTGNNNGMYMPVAPAYGGGYGNGGGFLGGEGIWAILVILFVCGGWGGGFGGFGGGFGGGMFANDALLAPYFTAVQTQGEVARGFDTQNLGNQIGQVQGSIDSLRTENQLSGLRSDVTSGFADTALGIAGVNQNICQTGNNVVSAITGAQNALASQMYANQISDLERSFASQTAVTGGLTNISAQLAQASADNRLAVCQTNNTIQSESSATRFADANNTRDIITNATSNTQAILDKLCQLELDGVKREVEAKNDRISDLQNQLNMAAMRESQTAQNAFIQQGLTNEVDALYNRLNNCPVPTTPVYGRTPIFTCGGNSCGCGCGNM